MLKGLWKWNNTIDDHWRNAVLGGARGREGLLSERLWRPTGADRRGRGDAQSELLPGGQILPLKALSIHPLISVYRLGCRAKEEGAVNLNSPESTLGLRLHWTGSKRYWLPTTQHCAHPFSKVKQCRAIILRIYKCLYFARLIRRKHVCLFVLMTLVRRRVRRTNSPEQPLSSSGVVQSGLRAE